MVNFYVIDPKHIDDLVPVKTFLEMFIHCAFLVGPAMLFGAVEEGRFCFSDVGFSTTWTLESTKTSNSLSTDSKIAYLIFLTSKYIPTESQSSVKKRTLLNSCTLKVSQNGTTKLRGLDPSHRERSDYVAQTSWQKKSRTSKDLLLITGSLDGQPTNLSEKH